MQRPTEITRRRFLIATAGAAGGVCLPSAPNPAAANDGPTDEFASTDHFWYRLQPEDGPYIDLQRGNKAFGFSNDAVFLSEDNGRTWPHRLAFANARHVTFSHILSNGNIVFATRAHLYLSTDNLESCRPITLIDMDGDEYRPHTPRNPDNPGWYFHTPCGVCSWEIDGRDMLVWGNYCSVIGGAAPVNIYYSTDNGQTVKIAYRFGQNPYHRDDGSGGGGRSGTLLGDPDNPVFCRHLHSVAYNPAEDAFYACSGDHDRAEGYECHWLRGVYDRDNDRWQWNVLVSDRLNSRYKSGGINFVDGQLYFVSDANGPPPHDRGIFRCDPADIADPEKHTLLYHPQYECSNMIIQDEVILAAHLTPASPFATGFIISTDLGQTWSEYDLKELGNRSPKRFHEKNGEGWFRADLRVGWIRPGEVIFLKPKPA